MSGIWLFAGPSLRWSEAMVSGAIPIDIPADIRLLPPARRGDVLALIAAVRENGGTPGIILLADGLFHYYRAVGHEELRVALEAGWRIWGVSSLGAIRAAEMRTLGMRGYGRVYRLFADAATTAAGTMSGSIVAPDADFRDDEVALLHEVTPPYRPISEPLVHLRAALDLLVEEELLSAELATIAVSQLAALWFGERTWQRLESLVVRLAVTEGREDRSGAIVACLRTNRSRFRVKTADLYDLLHARPWACDADQIPPPSQP